MITERKYLNALLIVKCYQEEQDKIKLSLISCANITSDTLIESLYYAGIITARLYNILNLKFYKTIGDLSNLDIDELRRWRNVGNQTIVEFLKLKEYGKDV